MGASVESLQGPSAFPGGIYELRLDGFEPKFSKDKGSVNYNPKFIVVNHPTLNDRRVFDNLNSKAGWVQLDLCHALGFEMEVIGDTAFLPGEFQGPDNNPTDWHYIGPLVGRTLKVEIAEVDYKGKTNNKIKRFLCVVPGCKAKHSENLIGKP